MFFMVRISYIQECKIKFLSTVDCLSVCFTINVITDLHLNGTVDLVAYIKYKV